jgi:lipopolysaccharide transport system ATP-binding protein
MDPSIVIDGASRIFRTHGVQKVAVAPLKLNVGQGERLGIVGRNGAGKSTLLHMIAGLSSPTSGSIDINGRVTSVMTLGVGLRENLSGRENIYIDGELQGKARDEIDLVINEIVDFAELGEFIDLEVRTYSTGMKARLAFSMISHIAPEILIIDEALSVGDAAFATKATARIKEICARGRIVIIVSHGMKAINEICNRCLWMENGKVIMDGEPSVVTAAYIDSVRNADDEKLKINFRKYLDYQSFETGWEITQIDSYTEIANIKRTRLEAGQPTRFVIKANIPSKVKTAVLRVRIFRLDDLLVFDETFLADNYRLKNQSVGMKIQMESLLLGTAVYKIDVSIQDLNCNRAKGAGIFEVFTHTPSTGGKPMIIVPTSVSSAVVN